MLQSATLQKAGLKVFRASNVGCRSVRGAFQDNVTTDCPEAVKVEVWMNSRNAMADNQQSEVVVLLSNVLCCSNRYHRDVRSAFWHDDADIEVPLAYDPIVIASELDCERD